MIIIINTPMVQVRRLHKKTSKEDLRAFAETFGGVERVNIFYGTNSDKSAAFCTMFSKCTY